MKKVILTSLLAFILSLIIFIGVVIAWFAFFANNQISRPSNSFSEEETEQGILGDRLDIPRKTNFLLMGLDQTELLSDVILVGCFDSKTYDITLISIPRDTYVDMSDELRSEMRADGIYLPSQLKINAIHSYAGVEKGADYLQKYLEEMLGIEIDFYAEVNTKAFRDIVDAVGGIDMEIRPQGYYYYDPTQDLSIEVPGGMQHLDGEMAEGVVRYRHDYAQGDIERIEVQKEFMDAFFTQVLDKKNLTENGLSILKTCIEYTNTNFPIGDLPLYLPYASKLSADNLIMVTAPGNPKTIGGLSYYLLDDDKMQQIVNEVFYGSGLPKLDESISNLTIEVLNGSNTSMLATTKKEQLNEIGYNVVSIGDYDGEKVPQTRIYANEGVDTQALDVFFNNTQHLIYEDESSNYDITIVLGTTE